MQVFPSSLRELWTTWELPVMVLLSLFLQVVLIPMGHKRKYCSNNYLRWLLWLAYLSADYVATISLGILSNSGGHSLEPRYVIRAFWAPFFLLHLGGPDTITAYSMQDNDMWLRHFLSLLIQTTLSFYVFVQALQPTAINFIALPMFLAGITKYGERTWALRFACSQQLRDLDVPLQLIQMNSIHDLKFPIRIDEQSPRFNDIHILHVARCLFERNKWVFVDSILSFNHLKQSLYYFVNFDFETAFKVVELELGFLHDFIYTKASFIFHTRWGYLLRLIGSSSIIVAIITFCSTNKHRYPSLDVYLTFILLFGALGVEIYSVFLLLCSDWCVTWLTQIDNFLARLILKAIYGFGWSIGKRRWSNSVPQYNLITHSFEDIQIYRHGKFLRNSYTTTISQPVSDELKKRIFEQLKEIVESVDYEDNSSRELPDWVVRKRRFYDHLGWSTELDSVQRILLWHIATEVCYYSDHKNKALILNSSLLEDIKLLSNYLTYLLANRHTLFSNGMGRTRFDATVIDAKDFLRRHIPRMLETVNVAYDYILQEMKLRVFPRSDVKELEIGSEFNNGCLLAQELQKVEENERWEIISREWVELLAKVACECKFYDHIEQLGHGGDLLTHVWLLMHHIGYTNQAYDVTTDVKKAQIQQFRMVLKRGTSAASTEVATQRNSYPSIHFILQ